MPVKALARRALRKLELPEREQATTQWINDDLKPVPLERQTWGMLPVLRTPFAIR